MAWCLDNSKLFGLVEMRAVSEEVQEQEETTKMFASLILVTSVS